MATVSGMVCACELCSCVVTAETAVAKNGQYYCTQACADGHPEGSEACAKPGCCGAA
ncbi:MAG: metallothionein [Cyanophyceae cyanobacterium]